MSVSIAEIIGPSGAGKSSVSECLDAAGGVRAGVTIWGLPMPLIAASAVRAIPKLGRVILGRRRFRLEELKQVIRLEAFYRYLTAGRNESATRLLILDEGAVFALAKLRADRNGAAKGSHYESWESEQLDRWARLIDTVIWLDAPDDLLIERINSRDKKHRMKNRPAAEIAEFLHGYREAYDSIVKELESRRDLCVYRYETADMVSSSLAKEILAIGNGRSISAA